VKLKILFGNFGARRLFEPPKEVNIRIDLRETDLGV
jgi:hypothetical protein